MTEKETEKEKRGSNKIDDEGSEDVSQMQYKIVILGDGAVGKTSICNRFVKDNFAQHYKQTIGLDFFVKRLNLTNDKSKIQVAMQLWDIGGQSVGSNMLQKYIHGADCIILCYDITNYETFSNLKDWLCWAGLVMSHRVN